MPTRALTLESLEHLDLGKASAAFNSHIKRVATDCIDRPGDANARKVTMEVAIKPVINDDGTAERIKMQIQVKSTVPSHRTRVYDLGLRHNGVLVFSEDSPTNFDQSTMFDNGEDA